MEPNNVKSVRVPPHFNFYLWRSTLALDQYIVHSPETQVICAPNEFSRLVYRLLITGTLEGLSLKRKYYIITRKNSFPQAFRYVGRLAHSVNVVTVLQTICPTMFTSDDTDPFLFIVFQLFN